MCKHTCTFNNFHAFQNYVSIAFASLATEKGNTESWFLYVAKFHLFVPKEVSSA